MSAEPKSSSSELQAPPFESSPPTGRSHGFHSRKGYQPLPQEDEVGHVEPQEAQPELVPQSAAGAYPPMQPLIPSHETERNVGNIPGPYPAYQSALTPPTAGYPPTGMQPPVPPFGYPPPPPAPQGGYPIQYQAGGYDPMSSPRAPTGYAPAPPVLQQQQSSNVVVVNQPGSTTEGAVTVQLRVNDHMGLTLVIMLLCLLHGNLPALACLLPALCFSCLVSQRNESGDYEGARSFSNLVLFCDILVFVYYVLAVIAVIATVVVLFVVGIL